MTLLEKQQFPCLHCGSNLQYIPGTNHMNCVHCGESHHIKSSINDKYNTEELDFYKALHDVEDSEILNTTHISEAAVIECQQCAATFPFDEHQHAGHCPYCGTHIVADTKQKRQITPWALLPFDISAEQAWKAYQHWLKKLWFAPNKLKKYAKTHEKLNGMYVPYWTFDSHTTTHYSGQRGTYYYVSVTVPTQVNGRTVMKRKRVRKVRWQPVSGMVSMFFDDVLVYASKTLPKTIAKELEPWDLNQLIPYQHEYISGFTSELYQVGLKEGFNEMTERIRPRILKSIHQDIGGDTQRIHQVQTSHNDIRFRHILLPFWTAGFRYNKKTYQFVVNGRTGEVQGDRPYSAIKIATLVIFIMLVLAGLGWFIYENPQMVQFSIEY